MINRWILPPEFLGGDVSTADQIFSNILNGDNDSVPSSSSSNQSCEISYHPSDPGSGVLLEGETFFHGYRRIHNEEIATDGSSAVSVDSTGSSDSDLSHRSRFNTVDVQTDIAGIDCLIAYGEPVEDYGEMLTNVPTIEKGSYEDKFADGNEDIRLVCCKCQESDAKEKLSKCHKAGLDRLKSQCEQLGLVDMLGRIQAQWELGKLRIHQSCRQDMHNKIIAQSRRKG